MQGYYGSWFYRIGALVVFVMAVLGLMLGMWFWDMLSDVAMQNESTVVFCAMMAAFLLFWPEQCGHMPTTILQSQDGNLYGTAQLEGDRGASDGIVYTMRPDGSPFRTLHIFRLANGALPFDLILDPSNSMLYGTTILGGQSNSGTIFKMGTNGQGFQTLHAFCARK